MRFITLRRGRPWTVAAVTLLFSGLCAASASAHATMSPAVSKANVLQFYTLSVPTEEEGATTTKIELTVPKGFAIDSFQAAPGWTRTVDAQGSGEAATVQKVTWTGGKTPTEEDSVFGFNAEASKTGTITFTVQQSYSDGTVVNWSGAADSDTPAPTIEAVKSFGGGGSSDTIGVIALILAIIALLLGVIALAGGKREMT